MKCWYYLHENGDLIHKRLEYDPSGRDFADSPFCKKYWKIDTDDRFHAWAMLAEALACGANKDRVVELAGKWGCNFEDAQHFGEVAGMSIRILDGEYMASFKDGDGLKPGEWSDTPIEAVSSLVGFGDLSGKFRGFC